MWNNRQSPLYRFRTAVAAFGLVCALSGCDSGFKTMNVGEYGAVFSALPPMEVMGRKLGGMQKRVLLPAETEFIFPWETLYRFDTSIQTLDWGAVGEGSDAKTEDHIYMRSADGNEVALAVAIQYHVIPEKVPHVIQYVGPTADDVRRSVSAIARADIRTQMNALLTRDIYSRESKLKTKAIAQVERALRARLEPEGIAVDAFIYKIHRFSRLKSDGKVDDSYQQLLEQTQAKEQETEQEVKRRFALEKEYEQKYQVAEGEVNRRVQIAEGQRNAMKRRGELYLDAQQSRASAVLETGRAEAEGIQKKIEALSGPGGEKLVQREIIKELVKAKPRFIILGGKDGGSSKVDFQRIDMNDLIRQAGFFGAVHDGLSSAKEGEKAGEQIQTPAPPSQQ